MRKLLHHSYRAGAGLAGLALIGMLLMIVTEIAGGLFGFFIRGLDAYAGYLLAASLFLALPYTLQQNEHIRVTLVLQRLPDAPRRWIERLCLLFGILMAGLLAYAMARLAWYSWLFGDVSSAPDQTPLWLPQSLAAAGAVLLAIAFIEAASDHWRGLLPASAGAELSRVE